MNHFIDFANVTNSTPALFCLIRLIYEFVVPGIRSTSLLWYSRAAAPQSPHKTKGTK
jgi:hypothetical protein